MIVIKKIEEHFTKRQDVLTDHIELYEFVEKDQHLTFYAKIDYVTREWQILNGCKGTEFKFGGKLTLPILEMLVKVGTFMEGLLNGNQTSTTTK